jgi:probable rRNA maturation factor
MERRRKHPSDRPSQNAHRCLKIFNRQSDLPLKASSVRRLLLFLLQEKEVSYQEVALYFVTMHKIQKLHADFFQDPSPTDCMTFPLKGSRLGEIFICPKAALDYNRAQPYMEVTLYIIHSLLHLLGYEDIDKRKRARMRKEERRLMKLVEKHGCQLQPSL